MSGWAIGDKAVKINWVPPYSVPSIYVAPYKESPVNDTIYLVQDIRLGIDAQGRTDIGLVLSGLEGCWHHAYFRRVVTATEQTMAKNKELL